jgi:hypothetical protein
MPTTEHAPNIRLLAAEKMLFRIDLPLVMSVSDAASRRDERSRCVLVRTSFDCATRLGDVFAGSRRGVTGAQKWQAGRQREQGEG